MKALIMLSLVFVCSFSAYSQNPAPAKSSSAPLAQTNVLPIKRVILYSNGMVHIERRGIVRGDASVDLSFKQSQIDDVLKSMLVLDLGKGTVGAVSYNASVPPSVRTAEIPFSIDSENNDDNGGMAGILGQLQGAKVIVSTAAGTASGAILNVKKQLRATGTAEKTNDLPVDYSLVIASETGEISSFELSKVRSIRLLDDETRRDVNEFANASALARRRDAKTINITSEGVGERELIVSYTVSAPIWKTTYRVVLDEQGKPFFQGWAIVDNVSEEDWQKVKLSLVSGSPVSFIQPLQNPLYRHRPVIEIPDDLNLEPQIYEPTGIYTASSYGAGVGGGVGDGRGMGNGAGSVNESVMISSEPSDVGLRTGFSDLLSSQNSGVKTAASGNEIGDLFEYRIEQPITVQRNRSALIPIVQTKMEGERVSVYRESARKDRPMSGVLLKNTSNLTLEGGALTVLEQDAYAGEALMERLKPKENRLISFALDLGTLVTLKDDKERESAKLIRAVNGVFQVHFFNAERKTYNITNQTDRPKTLFVEHPVREKWLLSDETEKPFEATQNHYRFRLELKPFETRSLTVAERLPLVDSYQISGLRREDLELFLTRKYIDEPTRAKLNRLIEIREEIAKVDASIRALGEEEKAIANDQARLRENIEALAKTPEAKTLIARYISKADSQESRIEGITRERQTRIRERETLQASLQSEIKSFELK